MIASDSAETLVSTASEPQDGGRGGSRAAVVAAEVTAAFLGALTLAIAVTWPLASRIDSVVHDRFDPILEAVTIDHVQQWFGGNAALWNAGYYVPAPDTLAFSNALIGISWLMLPLRWFGAEPIAVLNAALLVGTAVSAAAAYLCARVVTRDSLIAAVCAVGYGFGPFPTAHLGHVFATWRQGVPLAVAAVWVVARSPRWRWWAVAALAATLAFDASNSFYSLAFSAVAGAVTALVCVRDRRALIASLAGFAGGAAVAVVVAQPYIRVSDRYPDFTRSLETFGLLGADLFMADGRLSVWGGVIGDGPDLWPRFYPATFPGLMLTGLALIGLLFAIRIVGQRAGALAAALMGVGVVLALGTDATGWRRFTPVRLLWEWVEPWRALRASERAFAIALLGMALLAGGAVRRGVSAVRSSSARPVVGVIVVLCIAGVALLEGRADWYKASPIAVRAVDEVLAERSEPGGVVYLPIGGTGSASTFAEPQRMLGATRHGRAMVNGYSGYEPPSLQEVASGLASLPDAQAMELLGELGIGWVVVTPFVAGSDLSHLLDPIRAAPLVLEAQTDSDLLYRVPKP